MPREIRQKKKIFLFKFQCFLLLVPHFISPRKKIRFFFFWSTQATSYQKFPLHTVTPINWGSLETFFSFFFFGEGEIFSSLRRNCHTDWILLFFLLLFFVFDRSKTHMHTRIETSQSVSTNYRDRPSSWRHGRGNDIKSPPAVRDLLIVSRRRGAALQGGLSIRCTAASSNAFLFVYLYQFSSIIKWVMPNSIGDDSIVH